MISKYLSCFYITAKQTTGNKALLAGTTFFLFILLVIYNRLWNAIGIESGESGIQSKYIWYLLIAEIIILSPPKTDRIILDDIQNGTMSYYINKPVSFFWMRYMESAGMMTVSFLFMLTAGTIIALLLTPSVPFSWADYPVIVLMAYFSSLVNVLLLTAVGFSALWLNDTKTLGMAVQRLAFIFGGAIFPLSIYPDWFVDISRWSPFLLFLLSDY